LTLLPLAFALGQGSEMQQPLAIAIISGLIVQLPLVLGVMPVLFDLTQGRTGTAPAPAALSEEASDPPLDDAPSGSAEPQQAPAETVPDGPIEE
jgi:hypothetical protein